MNIKSKMYGGNFQFPRNFTTAQRTISDRKNEDLSRYKAQLKECTEFLDFKFISTGIRNLEIELFGEPETTIKDIE